MTGQPTASVVVASFRGLDVLAECLNSLRPQCRALGAELLLARGPRESAEALDSVAAECRLVAAPIDADIPRLRGIGLAAARGEWVGLTEDHCVADTGWLDALMEARDSGADVLGGSMGNAKRERPTDCGAFFSEYGFFGANRNGSAGHGAPLITGANVAYHRNIVSEVAGWAQNGSWENVIHDRLHAAGRRFHLVPKARVRQNLHYGLGAFCRDRFDHGRDYAATRSRGLSAWRRAGFAAATPILPLLLASRIARAADPEERPYFRRGLPATLTFLAAWSAGEAVGYLRGAAAE